MFQVVLDQGNLSVNEDLVNKPVRVPFEFKHRRSNEKHVKVVVGDGFSRLFADFEIALYCKRQYSMALDSS